jgi:hypothetical protein
MESAKRKCRKFLLCITQSKKHLKITQKSVPTTNERTMISENKYFLVYVPLQTGQIDVTIFVPKLRVVCYNQCIGGLKNFNSDLCIANSA